jgi:WD40 repeat protein
MKQRLLLAAALIVLVGYSNSARATETPSAITLHQGVLAGVISQDGRWFVAGCQDGAARVWDLTATDVQRSVLVLPGHAAPVNNVQISADNHWIASGSYDHTARLWNLTAANPAETGRVLRGHEGAIHQIRISPDGRWLVTTSDDLTARVWDLTAADPSQTAVVLGGHNGRVSAFISPDSHWLVTGGEGGPAQLWDLQARQFQNAIALKPPGGEAVRLRAISPNSRWLVTANETGKVHLWDLTAGRQGTGILLSGHKDAVANVKISSNSRWLATASSVAGPNTDSTVRLWDLTAADVPQSVIVLHGHTQRVIAMAMSPDNHWLATVSEDGAALLWDLTAKDIAQSSTPLDNNASAAAFSADNRWVATGGSGVRLRELKAVDVPPLTLQPSADGRITYLEFSPDNRWLDGHVAPVHAEVFWDQKSLPAAPKRQ